VSVVAYAPASIGNVSVGFDVLGAALAPIGGELLGDRVKVFDAPRFSLETVGAFAHKLPADPDSNIVLTCYKAYQAALAQSGKEIKPLAMVLEKNMPIGSGLGSSASSIVAALVALNEFHANALDANAMLLLMGELEGQISGSIHYDNVAPAYLGGVQLMLEAAGVISQNVPCFEEWYWVLTYPGISISTAEARAILPAQYRRSDCLAYGRHLAGFVHACYSRQPELAAAMLKDVIAEPYRQQLIPGFVQAREYAAQSGALATGISGSGPTVFMVTTELEQAERLKHWMETNFIQNDSGFSYICRLDNQGARITGPEL